jgi:hypothetical protein
MKNSELCFFAKPPPFALLIVNISWQTGKSANWPSLPKGRLSAGHLFTEESWA